MRNRLRTELLALGLIAAVVGCSRADKDSDHDGFTREEGDCNDDVAAVNPNGSVVADGAAWLSAEFDCPLGAVRLDVPSDDIRVHLKNDSCSAVTISNVDVQMTVVDSHGTFNRVGETFGSSHVSFSPSSVAAGSGTDVTVDATMWCSNDSGGDFYNAYQATVTLQTSAGSLRATTSNTHTTRFGSLPGGAGDAVAGRGFAPSGNGARIGRR